MNATLGGSYSIFYCHWLIAIHVQVPSLNEARLIFFEENFAIGINDADAVRMTVCT